MERERKRRGKIEKHKRKEKEDGVIRKRKGRDGTAPGTVQFIS